MTAKFPNIVHTRLSNSELSLIIKFKGDISVAEFIRKSVRIRLRRLLDKERQKGTSDNAKSIGE